MGFGTDAISFLSLTCQFVPLTWSPVEFRSKSSTRTLRRSTPWTVSSCCPTARRACRLLSPRPCRRPPAPLCSLTPLRCRRLSHRRPAPLSPAGHEPGNGARGFHVSCGYCGNAGQSLLFITPPTRINTVGLSWVPQPSVCGGEKNLLGYLVACRPERCSHSSIT